MKFLSCNDVKNFAINGYKNKNDFFPSIFSRLNSFNIEDWTDSKTFAKLIIFPEVEKYIHINTEEDLNIFNLFIKLFGPQKKWYFEIGPDNFLANSKNLKLFFDCFEGIGFAESTTLSFNGLDEFEDFDKYFNVIYNYFKKNGLNSNLSLYFSGYLNYIQFVKLGKIMRSRSSNIKNGLNLGIGGSSDNNSKGFKYFIDSLPQKFDGPFKLYLGGNLGQYSNLLFDKYNPTNFGGKIDIMLDGYIGITNDHSIIRFFQEFNFDKPLSLSLSKSATHIRYNTLQVIMDHIKKNKDKILNSEHEICLNFGDLMISEEQLKFFIEDVKELGLKSNDGKKVEEGKNVTIKFNVNMYDIEKIAMKMPESLSLVSYDDYPIISLHTGMGPKFKVV